MQKLCTIKFELSERRNRFYGCPALFLENLMRNNANAIKSPSCSLRIRRNRNVQNDTIISFGRDDIAPCCIVSTNSNYGIPM